jgi:hypothetical protein
MDINYERNTKVRSSNLKVVKDLRIISIEEFRTKVETIPKL